MLVCLHKREFHGQTFHLRCSSCSGSVSIGTPSYTNARNPKTSDQNSIYRPAIDMDSHCESLHSFRHWVFWLHISGEGSDSQDLHALSQSHLLKNKRPDANSPLEASNMSWDLPHVATRANGSRKKSLHVLNSMIRLLPARTC